MRALWVVALIALAGCSTERKPAASCGGIAGHRLMWVPGGRFTMGEDPRYAEEGPPRPVEVAGFWISEHEVTNAEFADFVAKTGYRTLAERAPPVLPDAPEEMRVPGSAVFHAPEVGNPSWWRWVVGAEWRHPEGPGSTIERRNRYPVVQIAYDDALAYAKWAGLDLPTEEQWEFAARGGQAALPEPVDEAGKPQANYYQGVFPQRDLQTDGYRGRAPVGCFKPNGYGLYDMIGNVWEWTSADGRRAGASEPVKIIKGGSFLCAANYCARYRPAARQFQERGLGTDHIGFRLVDNRRPAPGR